MVTEVRCEHLLTNAFPPLENEVSRLLNPFELPEGASFASLQAKLVA